MLRSGPKSGITAVELRNRILTATTSPDRVEDPRGGSQLMKILPHELAGIHVKIRSRHTGAKILLSAGSLSDKTLILRHLKPLQSLNVQVFATEGTFRFLRKNGFAAHRVFKISDGRSPNIRGLLEQDRLDLVINVLTGDPDYDEASDYRLIRALAIDKEIPIYTDPRVAVLALDKLALALQTEFPEQEEPWDMRSRFFKMVADNGGFACHHAHFDKAYVISLENLNLGRVDMQKKWTLFRYIKENYTQEDLVQRISRAAEAMIAQGAKYCRTMVDADSIVKLLPIQAALEVKKRVQDRITMEVGIQALEGVVDPKARRFFEEACERADFIGGLPSRDRPMPEKHLDIILGVGKRLNKTVDVHVDQENNPEESETELLALKTLEHGLEGRVRAVHAISVAAKPLLEQKRIATLLHDAGVGVIVCPSAALSMKQLNREAPLHNSIAPVPLLLEAEVPVYLGVDNIYDLFMPIVDGDMWFECRVLMESTRFYDLEVVAQIAAQEYVTNTSGGSRSRSRSTPSKAATTVKSVRRGRPVSR